ncbi:MAG: YihY/virulence factor BrkB family protein [Actinobacteria bacterium]|nr:YihY/virulence factor BrkB family protein [Actinomycetota bacterium]
MAIKDRLGQVPLVGTALRVQERYEGDAANQLAAAIAFFGFLSVFPLLLVGLAVAGFVLAGDPAAQREVVEAITGAIPGFQGALGESQIGAAVETLIDNRGGVGIVGLVTLLLSGLRVVDASSVATGRVFRVEAAQNAVQTRLRELGVLAVLGTLVLVGAGMASLTGATGSLATLLGLLAALAIDGLMFLFAYRYLNPGPPPIGRLWPGAVLAATGWVVLKTFGATFVSDKVAEANALYGTLGGVFALLFLLFLGARLYLYGAELNAVLAEDDGSMDADAVDEVPSDARTDPPDLDAPTPWPGDEHIEDHRPPLAPAPAANERSDAVSTATVARLEEADDRTRELRDPHPVQRAIAFVLGLGIVAGLIKAIGLPGRND